MLRLALAVLIGSVASHPALGQGFGDWFRQPPTRWDYDRDARGNRAYSIEQERRRYRLEDDQPRHGLDLDRRRWMDDERLQRTPARGSAVLNGGPRPAVPPQPPAQIAFSSACMPGSIVIDTAGRGLYLVQSPSSALVYPISVGREGFGWIGSEAISRIADWPDWHPPAEMRERDPRLPDKMTGGLRNPLGAKALYLGKTLYRIHGTDDAQTIGQATSSGCFRMSNGHVVDLASRVSIGTKVIVVSRLPASLARSGY
jgi:lipoprotein-anchoring transpeptidase ErfK/SrfK